MPGGPRKPKVRVKKVAKLNEDEDIAIVREDVERPSQIAIARVAPIPIAQREPITPEQPFMYRILNASAQRCTLDIKNLCSFAAFIVVVDLEKTVFVWIGSSCSKEDSDLANSLGLDVLRRDQYQYEATEVTHVIREGEEKIASLKPFLQKISSEEGHYRSKLARAERLRDPDPNYHVSVGTIERFQTGSLSICETGHTACDSVTGNVPRATFPTINMTTMVVSSIGLQWDLWVSRGCSDNDIRDAKTFLVKKIVDTIVSSNPEIVVNSVLALEYLHITRQGCERVLYRSQFKIFTDYEPPGRCVPLKNTGAANSTANHMPGSHTTVSRTNTNHALTKGNINSNNSNYNMKDKDKLGGNAKHNDTSNLYELLGINNMWDENTVKVKAPNDNYNNTSIYTNNNHINDMDNDVLKRKVTFGEGALSNLNNNNNNNNNSSYYGNNGNFGQNNLDEFGFQQINNNNNDNSNHYNTSNYSGGSPRSDYLEEDAPQFGFNAQNPDLVEADVDPKAREGRRLLTADMLEFREDAIIGPEARLDLIHQSERNPNILVGWQIEIDEGRYIGIHVITGWKKDVWHKSYFRLSSFVEDDDWIRLRRGPKKSGIPFRPLRQVIF